MTLDDDIARIAALRGKKPDDYTAERRGIHETQLQMLEHMSGDLKRDAKAFDDLPAASRALIAEWPRPLNPQAWSSLLDQYDETFLIRAFRAYWVDQRGTSAEPIRRKPRRRLS